VALVIGLRDDHAALLVLFVPGLGRRGEGEGCEDEDDETENERAGHGVGFGVAALRWLLGLVDWERIGFEPGGLAWKRSQDRCVQTKRIDHRPSNGGTGDASI
jgi:hypothetical protein